MGSALIVGFTAPSALAQDDGPIVTVTVPLSPPEVRPDQIPTAAFVSRSPLGTTKFSPDGSRFAISTTVEGKDYILVFDSETIKPVFRVPLGEDRDLDWFRWAGDQKILFGMSNVGQYFTEEARYTRLFMLHVDEGWAALLGRKDSQVLEEDNVIYVDPRGEYVLVANQNTPQEYPSVVRLTLEQKSKRKTLQEERQGIWRWHADDTGFVRMGTGWVGKRLRVYYRSGPEERMKLVAKVHEDQKGSDFLSVIQLYAGDDVGYALREDRSGKQGLHRVDFSTRETVEVVHEIDDWDIDGVYLRDYRPVGVSYTDDRERAVWFDEEYKALYRKLDASLTESEVWVTARARDNSRMLVWGGGPSDPGGLYMYVPARNSMAAISNMRPLIDPEQLAKPKPISYESRDGVTIRAYLTLPRGLQAKGLPLIVMPHGGPYGVRDELTYNDEVQLLANRGYAVIQPNFRGSGGYGRGFFEKGRGQIGRAMQDDLDDAMDWAVEQGIADASRVCIVGGSYGGYAALWGAIRNPERYRCAASWAGVTDLTKQLSYDRSFFTRSGAKRWRDLVEGEGDVTMKDYSPYRSAALLKRPVLIAHGTEDTTVPFSQFKIFRKAVAEAGVPVEELVIEGEGHSFSSPKNEKAWYDALITFLAKHNPPD